MSPEYVRPYVKAQKNATTAEAIAEAATRPKMRFVTLKSAVPKGHAKLRVRIAELVDRDELRPRIRHLIDDNSSLKQDGA
jgi:transposase